MSDPLKIEDQIYQQHRRRCFMMAQRVRLNNALGSFIQVQLGLSLDKPENERKRIRMAADKLIATGGGVYADFVGPAQAAALPFEECEDAYLKELKRLAKLLPVWGGFGESIRGFGEASLATIVGEAGDLSNYSSVAKLWKRMGVAVLGGIRQGGLPKNAPAESWIEHGYSRKRRSRMWNIGDALIKAQVRKVDGDEEARQAIGPYGQVYLDRKAYEVARNPDIKPIVAHRRAQRYMEKRLLRHLWAAWRRCAKERLTTRYAVRTDHSNAGEQPARETIDSVETTKQLSRAPIQDTGDEPARQTKVEVETANQLSAAPHSRRKRERKATRTMETSGDLPSAPIPEQKTRGRSEPRIKLSSARSRATIGHMKTMHQLSRGTNSRKGSRKTNKSMKTRWELSSGKSSKAHASQ
jgi:hypothetical protein